MVCSRWLGIALATVPLSGFLSMLALPAPASPPVVVAVGIVLVVAGGLLIALARHPTADVLLAVAVANAAGVVLFAVWLALAWVDFGTSARVLIQLVGAALAALAAVELVAVTGGQHGQRGRGR
jgi:hypothetical protein